MATPPGHRVLTLQISGTGVLASFSEELQVPVPKNVRAGDVKRMLAGLLILPEDRISLMVTSSSGAVGKAADGDQLPNVVSVVGITSFERERHEYSCPHAIIGAGHMGLRMALTFVQEREFSFVQIDRNGKLGGTAWLHHANPTSKVQSEFGTYHLDYSVHNPAPTGLPPWPSRAELLRHFETVCDRWGLRGYMKFYKEMTGMEMVKEGSKQEYKLRLTSTDPDDSDDDDKESTIVASSVLCFPGNLSIARRVTFKGEDIFGGCISYGMFGEVDYSVIRDQPVALVGFGAFAVENIRTCCEQHASHIYLICRKKNLCMPRMVSWWLNNSILPVGAAATLKAMEVVYKMIGEDPWSYHSVKANSSKTAVTIDQSARFGIGDIYFLSRYYGKTEVVPGEVGKLTRHQVHIPANAAGGTKARALDATVLLKMLGFDPDFSVDKLMQVKVMTGYWCDGDHCRAVCSEFRSVYAQKFGGTSLSPFAIDACYMLMHVLHFPADFRQMMDSGMMPKHKADKKYPAVVQEAKSGQMMSILLGSLNPFIAQKLAGFDSIKRDRNLAVHSLEEVQKAAEDEWFEYCQLFRDEGDQRPFPPYPYPAEMLKAMVAEQDKAGMLETQRKSGRGQRIAGA